MEPTAGSIIRVVCGAVVVVVGMATASVSAQGPAAVAPAGAAAPTSTRDEGITPPADYVIGPDDALSIVYWRDADMSADVLVRPDGMVSLPLLNDIQAAGLTVEQLRASVAKAASQFVEGPNVRVIVREIKSRRVFITGLVGAPAQYPLVGPTTVLQLIAMAGGVQEYANKKNISIIRNENGQPRRYRFNYNDVMQGKNLQQNIELKPGDTVIVP